MTKKEMEELSKLIMKVVGDGFEAVVFPEFGKIDEKFGKVDKRFENMEQSMKDMKKELLEAFKNGQQSLSNTLEEVSLKLDKVAENQKVDRRRIDKLEGIVKVN